jgi:hypothetical protein
MCEKCFHWEKSRHLRGEALRLLMGGVQLPVLNDCMLLATGGMVSGVIRYSSLPAKQVTGLPMYVQWVYKTGNTFCHYRSLSRLNDEEYKI